MIEPAVVFRTRSAVEASIVRGLLEAHGFEAMVSPDSVWAIVPSSSTGGDDIAVAVPAAVADAARRLVESRRDLPATRGDEPSQGEGFAALEARIGHRFVDRTLLEHALTHRSRAHEDVTGGVVDNESLEFLGDAVVGLVIAEALYREYPDLDEGAKSKIRASLVSAGRLARLGEALGLGDHLLLGRGEEKTGGRRKTALLADALRGDRRGDLPRRRPGGRGGVRAARAVGAVRGVGRRRRRGRRRLRLQVGAAGAPAGARPAACPSTASPPSAGPSTTRCSRSKCASTATSPRPRSGRSKKDAEQQAAQRALQRSPSRPRSARIVTVPTDLDECRA